MKQEIPVYLFLGFLEAGKTKFIQETFEDERFDSGESTLLLVLEEGEIEYDSSRFAVKKFAVETVDFDRLSEEYLTSLVKKHKVERVVVECNGMKLLQDFFNVMPDGFMIAQVMTFFDSPTFLSYNQNLRQLVFDKVQYADLIVFNRFNDTFSQEEFHKIIRAMTRRPNIVFEYADGRVEYDEIEDPLPYDVNANEFEIEDRDYAFFYRDLAENLENYEGKVVTFKARAEKIFRTGDAVVGRKVMTCCAEDISFCGMVAEFKLPIGFKARDWLRIKGKIHIGYHKVYGQEGPVVKIETVEICRPPEEEVATFY